MRQLLLSAVGAFALLAGTVSVAQAESFGGGMQFGPRGEIRGFNFGISTGGNRGYGYSGGYPPGYSGAPAYGVPVQAVPVQVITVIPAQRGPTYIITDPCDPGYFTGRDGRCYRATRIR